MSEFKYTDKNIKKIFTYGIPKDMLYGSVSYFTEKGAFGAWFSTDCFVPNLLQKLDIFILLDNSLDIVDTKKRFRISFFKVCDHRSLLRQHNLYNFGNCLEQKQLSDSTKRIQRNYTAILVFVIPVKPECISRNHWICDSGKRSFFACSYLLEQIHSLTYRKNTVGFQ